MRTFYCPSCNDPIAKEIATLEIGDIMDVKIERLQGHKDGERTMCKKCGSHFSKAFHLPENWHKGDNE